METIPAEEKNIASVLSNFRYAIAVNLEQDVTDRFRFLACSLVLHLSILNADNIGYGLNVDAGILWTVWPKPDSDV